jgi:GPH family glycoside/pentoside/hexuronide:cation symporter
VPQVPLSRKIAYAVGDIGVFGCITAINSYLMFFYTDVALLGVGLAGFVKGLARFFDAVSDPVVGYCSDQTKTRWGRRRPWILGAALPFGLSLALLFRPPETDNQQVLFLYFLIAYVATYAFLTMILTPYYALGAELSSDYQERTQIVALRTLFANIGAIIGGFLPFIVARYEDTRTGYAEVTQLFAAVAVAAVLLVLFARERPSVSQNSAASIGDFLRGYALCLRNRAFRQLVATFFVMSVGGGLNQAVAVYALVYWLGFAPQEVGIIIPVYLGTACVALPFWTWLSGRIGKDVALRRLLVYETVILSMIYFLTPSKPLVYAFLMAAGFGVAGFINAFSLLADILDADELETGTQRGGAFFGFWTFSVKVAWAAGAVLVGWTLALVGYVPNVEQTPLVIETMRWLYGPAPALSFVAGYFFFRDFPLSRERLSEIQDALARRRETRATPQASSLGR